MSSDLPDGDVFDAMLAHTLGRELLIRIRKAFVRAGYPHDVAARMAAAAAGPYLEGVASPELLDRAFGAILDAARHRHQTGP